MNKNYLLLAGIVIALGIGMLFMPEKEPGNQVKPELLLAAIDDPSRFLSTDDITDRLVKKDPALLLIDVRPEKQFNIFAIPGAINIPVDSLISASARDFLNQNAKDKVFYSNSDASSDQAWIICKRMGLQRIYIMKGGLNQWFNTIVKAEMPGETAPAEAFDLYRFRIGARQYFFSSTETVGKSTESIESKKEVKVAKKPVEKSSGGGC